MQNVDQPSALIVKKIKKITFNIKYLYTFIIRHIIVPTKVFRLTLLTRTRHIVLDRRRIYNTIFAFS